MLSPMSVWLSVNRIIQKTADKIRLKFYEMVGHNPRQIDYILIRGQGH